jgi:hypothetical protein
LLVGLFTGSQVVVCGREGEAIYKPLFWDKEVLKMEHIFYVQYKFPVFLLLFGERVLDSRQLRYAHF